MAGKVRLFVEHDLGAEQSVALTREQAHYLFGVMRLQAGSEVWLFNGRDGEWLAEVREVGKRGGVLGCVAQTRPLQMPPDVWLCFAPIKKARTDFIVEKAVEMGAARICPILTEFTNSERVRKDRLQAHAIEAAEQCGATVVPDVAEARRLEQALADWQVNRRILFCDEARAGAPALLPANENGPWAIFIGPEGGFSPAERARLGRMGKAHAVSLGPRILRADTAAVAALTLWQAQYGDWRDA